MFPINRSNHAITIGLLALALSTTTATVAMARQAADSSPSRPTQAPPAQGLVIGKPAPAFELRDLEGKVQTLEQHLGKVIVLEWFSPACAEVRQQHLSGTMKSLLREHEKDSIVWLGINSTPAGQEGSGIEASMKARTELAIRFPILMDDDGAVAKLYRAKVTPTVFVIDEEGVLRYFGAIDNAPDGKLPESEKKLINYLGEALNSVMVQSELANPRTEAHGCPIKTKAKG